MPAEWQNVFIPFAAGLDESVHPKMTRIQVPLVLENVYFDQDQALFKRNGFVAIDSTFWSEAAGSFTPIGADGAIRELLSTGEELCAVGARRFFAFNEEHGKWYDRGPVSPFTGEQNSVFVDDRSWLATDAYTDGDYTLFAGRWFRHTSDAEWHGVQFRASSYDGSKTFAPVDVHRTVTVTVDRPHGPKCAACGTVGVDRQLLAMVGYDGDYTPTQDAEFDIYSYDLSTPHLPPTAVVTHTALYFDNYTDTADPTENASYATRTYDIIEAPNGDYIYAYIDRNTNIQLVRRDSAHNLDVGPVALTENTGYRKVAIHQNGSLIFLLAVRDVAAGTRQVECWTCNLSTLVAVNGPVNLHTLVGADTNTTDGENADHLGVTSSASEALWTYSVMSVSPTVVARNEQRQCYRTTTHTLTSPSSEICIYNCLALAKPFHRLGRFYLPASIGPSHASVGEPPTGALTYQYPAPAWNTAVVLDLDKNLPVENVNPEDPQTGGAYMVGIYHVGVAPNLANHDNTIVEQRFANRNNFLRGSLNAVSNVSDGNVFSYLSDRYTHMKQGGLQADIGNNPLKPLEPGTANDAQPRTGADYVALDFSGPITSTRLERGSAAIGGGAVFFYSGKECFELGFPIAPFIYERTETGALPRGYDVSVDLAWQSLWWCQDGGGFVHRGFPCPVMANRTTPAAGGDFGETIRVNTLPATSKPIPNAKIYVYDPSNNGVEIMNPVMVMPNRMQDNETGFYRDDDDFKGSPIYTLGGRLENVSPEGAAFVSVALNRLMVTGNYSRGRVHYSQEFTPGTAFEDALAPEMNEALGKVFPDGEQGVGVAEMDGQAILFTRKSIYGMAGTGPNPTGTVGDFQLQLITSDGGCVNGRSIAKFPDGVMFEGANGIYAILRNHDVITIGDPVQEQLAAFPLINRAVLWESMQLVVVSCTNSTKTQGILLCYDYQQKRWYVWKTASLTPFTSLAVHKDDLYAFVPGVSGSILKYDRTVFKDNLGAGDIWITQRVKSAHVQLNPNGWLRCKELVLLGERKDALDLHVDLYQNFATAPFQQETIGNAELSTYEDVANRLQPKVKPERQKNQAIQFEIYDSDPGSGSGQGAVMTGVVLQMAPKRGTSKVRKEQRR